MRHRVWLALPLLLVACAPTARTTGPYETKAVKTAESVRSAVESDLLVLDAVRKRHTLPSYVSVATSDAEDHGSSASSTFLSIQPPNDESDQLRDDLSKVLSDAEDVLGQVRVAGRRGDREALLFTKPGLERVSRALEHFAEEHRG